MSTLKELVNDLERESGTIYQAQRLTTVASPVGRQEKMVEWTIEAWRLIQTARTDWPWMRKEFQSVLIPNQRMYSAADLSITDFANWERATPSYAPFTLYDTALTQSDERELAFITYQTWKAKWDRGIHDAQRPIDYAIDSERRLCVGGKPDKAYVIRGAYRRKAQMLALDTDVPILPEEHHNIILWRAMMLMGGHDEAVNVVAHAQSIYNRLHRDLVNDSTEPVTA
tara:strand:+ start:256 stop:936 length:681 start_codon:yes stop_codon:yes gene_type:complete